MSLDFLRRHAPSLALFSLVVVPLLVRGGAPRDEDCPGGVWVKNSGSCGRNYWECTSTGDEVEASLTSSRLPLHFEQNRGQVESAYDFLARTHSHAILLSAGDALLTLASPKGTTSIRMDLDGAPAPAPEPEDRLPGVLNYFLGADPNVWQTNVAAFRRVRYRDVYPGIDVVYYGAEGELEHDFIVKPGADPRRIRMRFTGTEGLHLESDGSASIAAAGQRISWRKPVIFQERAGKRLPVSGSYRLDGDTLAFELGAYDQSQPLIIDPAISYATFIGRSAADAGARMAVDSAGNAYVVGYTMDPSFPRTGGVASSGAGFGNILLTKLNPSGDTVLFSTFIGGSSPEGALSLVIDRDGNLYIGGHTASPDFPTTPSAFKRQLQPPGANADRSDCTLTKLNATGNAILYSTYLGGTGVDACLGLAVDSSGAAYLTGTTDSTNFPVSEDAPQRLSRGSRDGFVAKINPAGSAVVYATLFGGNNRDAGVAITVDSLGAAYVVGHTTSTFGFPITANAFQRTYLGTTVTQFNSGDAFALKLNPAGTAFEYSTYLAGRRDEVAFSVAVDSQGNAYIAGNTTSTDFPTTNGALQTTFAGLGDNNIHRGGDAFVAKLNPTGSALVYSTLLGGSSDDWATAITIDSTGNAFVAGATTSPNFPVTQDAYQRTYGGSDPVLGFPTGDAFVAHLNPAGSALVYATYMGGAADEFAFGIALDSAGALHLSGMTRSRNFPVTQGAAQTQYGGADTVFLPMGDAFMARFAGSGGGNPASNVVLQGVASSASYAAGGVAPGEIIILGGTNIGPTNLATLAVAQGRVTTSLGATRVLFDEVPAPLIYVSGRQSSAVVPYAVARRQQTQIVVEYQGQRSAPLTMPVVPSKPALFSANSSGTGPGAILNEDFSVNTPQNPSQRGRVVQLFGTGEGQTNPEGVDGLLANAAFPRPVLPVSVTIGGRTADVLYAGAAPGGVAGFFQINAKIPEDSTTGNLPVVVTVGTARSQQGLTVAVQ